MVCNFVSHLATRLIVDTCPVSVAMEAIGDITASAEVSRVAVDGPEFDSRIQGGVLVCHHPPINFDS